MSKVNFLLGKGERLTKDIPSVKGGAPKKHPYSFDEAKERLQPMLKEVVSQINDLPDNVCPDNFAVASLTLHPAYIAKSYFPSDLLRHIGLEAVGSRPKKIKPEKITRGEEIAEVITTEVFVKGTKKQFVDWRNSFSNIQNDSPANNQIIEIEEISFPEPTDKLKRVQKKKDAIVYEVVLHFSEEEGENRYLPLFKHYLNTFGIKSDLKNRFYAGGLCFVQVEALTTVAEHIAKYTLVRVVRQMPPLRLLRPTYRSGQLSAETKIKLPLQDALDQQIKVAIFDGGIPKDHSLTKWVNAIDATGVGPSQDDLFDHGVAVTSAFLFGHIDPKKDIPIPYANVDHYRVLDNIPGKDPYELFEILDRINNVLASERYDFINLSLGPRLPIDDDDIHVWTAVLDENLSIGNCLATIAVGNDGDGDADTKANRIQVPADCVNAIAVGACDTPEDNWQRAIYSSIGPGRNPGIIKPDLVDFGGCQARPFLKINHIDGSTISPTAGTSFSAPTVLRIAAGVKAHFGNTLNSLAIRALLIHCCEKSEISACEVGWGRVARSLEDIVVCEDHVVRIVYQGTITASKYIRIPVPLPSSSLKGMVSIKATLCYATAIDPHHPDNYTRSGLDLTFRPNSVNFADGSVNPKTSTFFTKTQNMVMPVTEQELRNDAWKWENCLHAEKRFQSKTLHEPMFDIHYNARAEGRNDTKNQKIKYAMIISVEAPKVEDLYDLVVRKYITQLEPLKPVIDIPLRAGNA